MPSKYKSKTKPTQNAYSVGNYLKNRPVVPRCTNCGREGMTQLYSPFSKCRCGGTFQTFGVSNK